MKTKLAVLAMVVSFLLTTGVAWAEKDKDDAGNRGQGQEEPVKSYDNDKKDDDRNGRDQGNNNSGVWGKNNKDNDKGNNKDKDKDKDKGKDKDKDKDNEFPLSWDKHKKTRLFCLICNYLECCDASPSGSGWCSPRLAKWCQKQCCKNKTNWD